jgi:hypothetical protein
MSSTISGTARKQAFPVDKKYGAHSSLRDLLPD